MAASESTPSTTPASSDDEWPGYQFGCAFEGPTSVARLLPRVIALLIDWTLCSVIAAGLLGYSWGGQGSSGFMPLLVFAIENVLLVGTIGATPGHLIIGTRVTQLDGSAAGPRAAIIRTALLCIVLPALAFDNDQRGLHDRFAGTIMVKTR